MWFALLGLLGGAYLLNRKPSTVQIPQPLSTVQPTARVSPLIGRTLTENQRWLSQNGVRYRVVNVDGVAKPATADLVRDRWNLTVKRGVVTSAYRG